jgi:hypothetical protein
MKEKFRRDLAADVVTGVVRHQERFRENLYGTFLSLDAGL